MRDWREELCGTIPLKPVLGGGQPRLTLPTLCETSERMSSGGIYVPGWQGRFLKVGPPEKSTRLIHLAGRKEGAPVLMVSEATQGRRDCDGIATIDEAPVNTDMLRELDILWNKHQN